MGKIINKNTSTPKIILPLTPSNHIGFFLLIFLITVIINYVKGMAIIIKSIVSIAKWDKKKSKPSMLV